LNPKGWWNIDSLSLFYLIDSSSVTNFKIYSFLFSVATLGTNPVFFQRKNHQQLRIFRQHLESGLIRNLHSNKKLRK